MSVPRSVKEAQRRYAELEASERELHATVAVLVREFETGAISSGVRARVGRITADLPAAAREHLARDAEREQALAAALRRETNLRSALGAAKDLTRTTIEDLVQVLREYAVEEPPDA